jgi:hypothetical protein
LWWWQGNKRYRPLCLLLGITLLEELVADVLYNAKVDFTWIYHLFVIVEYGFVSWYFAGLVKEKYARIVWASIPAFAVYSASVSYWVYGFRSFPGMNINSEGLLVCIICSYILMNLPDVRWYDRLVKHPDFWICLGWLTFFTGTVFSNGLYSYLHGLDRDQALALFAVVNKPLNIVLYSCNITGFICAAIQKSTTLSS